MRIVSIFILLALAVAVYLARFAPGGDPAKESTAATVAVVEPQGATSAPDSEAQVPPGGAAEADSDLPTSFPAELKMRSKAGAAARVSQESRDVVAVPAVKPLSDDQAGDASSRQDRDAAATMDASTGDHPSQQATRRGPVLREPVVELDSSTVEALIAERLDSKPVAGRRPSREVRMPSKPADAEPVITEITLPKPPTDSSSTPAETAPQAQATSPETQDEPVDLPKTPKVAPRLDPTVELPGAVDPIAEPMAAVTPREDIPAKAPVGDTGPLPVTTQGLRGSVVEGSGKGIAKVQIDLVNVETGEVARTLTAGVDGIFVAPDLASGRYALAIKKGSVPLGISSPIGAGHHRTGSEPIGYGSVCVDVENIGAPTTAKIILPLSSGIQGTVLGRSGSPASGVLIRAISQVPGFGEERIIAESDAEGFFFLSLVPGPYELQLLLPGEGKPDDLMRRVDVKAKAGSALLLEAIDFSKEQADQKSSSAAPAPERVGAKKPEEKVATAKDPIQLPSMPPALLGPEPLGEEVRPVEARASVQVEPLLETDAVVLTDAPHTPVDLPEDPLIVDLPVDVPVDLPIGLEGDEPSEDDPLEGEGEGAGPPALVELRGRVISKWGESLPALSVLVESLDGTVLVTTQTSDEGLYVLEGVPAGGVTVRVANDLELNREGPRGITLLKRPRPMPVRTFSGQKRVTLEDVVVDVRRVFRLSGRIKVRPEALEEFKATLAPKDGRSDSLSDDQYRRAYLRGLRLVQKNRGTSEGPQSKRRGQLVPIALDGTFVWTCTLPADDILLVLESRSSRKGAGYGGPIGIPVTPAGVRPATLEIDYPARSVEEEGGDGESSFVPDPEPAVAPVATASPLGDQSTGGS